MGPTTPLSQLRVDTFAGHSLRKSFRPLILARPSSLVYQTSCFMAWQLFSVHHHQQYWYAPRRFTLHVKSLVSIYLPLGATVLRGADKAPARQDGIRPARPAADNKWRPLKTLSWFLGSLKIYVGFLQ